MSESVERVEETQYAIQRHRPYDKGEWITLFKLRNGSSMRAQSLCDKYKEIDAATGWEYRIIKRRVVTETTPWTPISEQEEDGA